MGQEVPYVNPFYFFEQVYLFFKTVELYISVIPLVIPWALLTLTLYVLSAIIFFVSVFVFYRSRQIRKKVEGEFMARFELAKDPEEEKREEWQDILDHIDSDNESQWKLALIDADKLLETSLMAGGYEGVSI